MGVLALPPEAAGGKWGEVCGERRQLEPEPWDPYLLWGQRRQLGDGVQGLCWGTRLRTGRSPGGGGWDSAICRAGPGEG